MLCINLTQIFHFNSFKKKNLYIIVILIFFLFYQTRINYVRVLFFLNFQFDINIYMSEKICMLL